MKKAIIDQLLIGLLVLGGIFVFIATVTDEMAARNKVYDLKKLAQNSVRAMAQHYIQFENICEAQSIANNILGQTALGSELITNNLISFVWRDSDSDGWPNSITATISGYKEDTFWYRFIQLDEFNIGDISASADVSVANATFDVTMYYGGSNAGYFNMIGTYEVDADGCVQNPELVLVDKTAHNIGDELGSIKMPQSRMFIIADGFREFGNKTASLDSTIIIEGCNPPTAEYPNEYPNVTIDGLTNQAPIYFQDTTYNSDNGYDHMQIIPLTVHDTYLDYIEGRIDNRSHTYDEWVTYAQANNINYITDPNHEYKFAMEDLPNGGDKDFNDILLDTTMVAIPKEIDPATILNDGIITATCNDAPDEIVLDKSVNDHCNGVGNGCKKCLNRNQRCDDWDDFVTTRCAGDQDCYDCMYTKTGCTQSIYDSFFN